MYDLSQRIIEAYVPQSCKLYLDEQRHLGYL